MYRMSAKPLISAQEINERLDTLSAEIAPCGFDIVVAALTGSFMFTADICRRIATPGLHIAFIRASSYGNSTESSGSLQLSGLEKLDIRGKKVLLIDDILDTGTTLLGVTQKLAEQHPASIKTCVLLNKESRRTQDIHADFVGFEVEDKFVVGYGLDYADMYRTFPEIWTLEENG